MAVGLSVDFAIRSGDAGYAAVIRCEGELDMVSAAKLIDAFDRSASNREARCKWISAASSSSTRPASAA